MGCPGCCEQVGILWENYGGGSRESVGLRECL